MDLPRFVLPVFVGLELQEDLLFVPVPVAVVVVIGFVVEGEVVVVVAVVVVEEEEEGDREVGEGVVGVLSDGSPIYSKSSASMERERCEKSPQTSPIALLQLSSSETVSVARAYTLPGTTTSNVLPG